jgi:hypothetical protein
MERRWLVVNNTYINLDQVVEIAIAPGESSVTICYAVMTLNTEVYAEKTSYSGLHSSTFSGAAAEELITWLRFQPQDVIITK